MKNKIINQNENLETDFSFETNNQNTNRIIKWKKTDLETPRIPIPTQNFALSLPMPSSTFLKLKKLTPIKLRKPKALEINDSKSLLKLPLISLPKKSGIHNVVIGANHSEKTYYNISFMIDQKIANSSPNALHKTPRSQNFHKHYFSNTSVRKEANPKDNISLPTETSLMNRIDKKQGNELNLFKHNDSLRIKKGIFEARNNIISVNLDALEDGKKLGNRSNYFGERYDLDPQKSKSKSNYQIRSIFEKEENRSYNKLNNGNKDHLDRMNFWDKISDNVRFGEELQNKSARFILK